MVFGLADEGLWLDEAYGHDMALLPWREMARITRDDAHPPLYYAILSLVVPLFGSTECGLRFPSVISAVFAVPFAHAIGHRVDGRRGAFAAAMAVGFSPFLQYYAREVRMYAPLVAVACAATYGLLRLVERPTRLPVAFYAATVATLLYTHYFGSLLIAAHGGALAVAALRRRISRTTLLLWSLALVAAGILFLPWALGIVTRLGAYAGGAATGTPRLRILVEAATGFAIGFPPHQLDQLAGSSRAMLFQYAAPLVLVALAIVGAWPRRAPGTGIARTIGPSVLAWAAAFPPIAVALVFGERQEIAPRYLAVAVAPLAILAALGALRLFERSRGLGTLSGGALLAISAIAIITFHRDARVWRDDFRSLASFIADNARPGQIVVANAGYIHRPLRYYLGDRWPIAQIAPRSADIAQQTEAIARSAPFVWLAIFQEYYADPEASARVWLDAHASPRVERRFRGNLRLIGYSTERPSADD